MTWRFVSVFLPGAISFPELLGNPPDRNVTTMYFLACLCQPQSKSLLPGSEATWSAGVPERLQIFLRP